MQLLARIGFKPSAAVAVTAVALVAGFAASPAHAVLVYSGPVNIVIPANLDGVYLNMVTGATGSTGGSVPGWDVNPYSVSALAPGFNLWGATSTTWYNSSGFISDAGGYVLASGTTIGAGPNFFRPGSGTDVGTAVTLNSANLFGVQFTNESGGTVHYGWIEVTFGASVTDRAITGYAFESVPGASVQAGVVPEPGTVALMLAGLAGVGAAARRARKS